MIQRWGSFIKESNEYNKIAQLLLEGYIDYSSEFEAIIDKIADRGDDIAGQLRDMNSDDHDDDDLKQNYIDVTSKEDMVSFISQKKFNQIEEKDEDADPYEVKGRSEIKIGRLVRSLFDLSGIKVSDKEVETFVNLYKSYNGPIEGEKFKLVKGNDIQYWYYEDNYYDTDLGDLGSSCMKDEDCQDYFDIYTENPKKVNLLILTVKEGGEEKLIGRALVWKLDVSPCEAKYFMDRVYTMKGSDINKFHDYANKQGWMIKFRNSSDLYDGLRFKYKDKKVIGKVEVKLDGSCDEYPFMDTFTFLSEDGDKVSNVGYKDGKMLDDTGGDSDECDDCNGRGVDECDNCDGTGRVFCDECDGEGEIDCTKCDGDGEVNGKPCNKCGKDGRFLGKIKCGECDENGEVKCDECGGTGGDECEECVGLLKKVLKQEKHK